MFSRVIISCTAALVLIPTVSAPLFSQQKPAPVGPVALEFPVTMQQKVVAGKTPPGTKVEAKLVVATLVKGVVFPRNAVFSGEVLESVAKSPENPSQLGIRLDSVRWKDQSTPLKVYLIAWYYPMRSLTDQEPPFGSSGEIDTAPHWGAAPTLPGPGSSASQPFPGSDGSETPEPAPSTVASAISPHRTPMKNVESRRNSDGSITITSHASTIKLDKLTTYVFATAELIPRN
jgi:hypothetical protein